MSSSPDSLDEIVADYLARNSGCDPCCGEDLDGFDKLPSLEVAIERAALCLTLRDRRHPHQWRLRPSVLREAEQVLQGCKAKIEGAYSFDALTPP